MLNEYLSCWNMVSYSISYYKIKFKNIDVNKSLKKNWTLQRKKTGTKQIWNETPFFILISIFCSGLVFFSVCLTFSFSYFVLLFMPKTWYQKQILIIKEKFQFSTKKKQKNSLLNRTAAKIGSIFVKQGILNE